MQQIVAEALGLRRLTLKDVEEGLRMVFAADPLRAERAVGQMYGHVFKKREELYEARRGRK
jgi:hypothetical protein